MHVACYWEQANAVDMISRRDMKASLHWWLMDMSQYELLVLVLHFFYIFLTDSSITKMEYSVLDNYVHDPAKW